MQALSQAAVNPEPLFVITKGERYLIYLVKIQGSQDPILSHSADSAGNFRNGLVHGVTKPFVIQGLEESATAFKVNLTKMLARRNKKKKCRTQNFWRQTIQRKLKSSGYQQRPKDRTTPTYASPATSRYPQFMLKKIVEYNSSTSQEIVVSCVKTLTNQIN